jgi:hypothetical protein
VYSCGARANAPVKPVVLAAKLGAANNIDGNRMPKIIGNNNLVFLIFSRSSVLFSAFKVEDSGTYKYLRRWHYSTDFRIAGFLDAQRRSEEDDCGDA